MTSYADRFFIVCTVGKASAANNMAAAWDPDTGGVKTFGALRLSASGAEPATHLGATTPANQAMRSGIGNALTRVPFVALYRAGDGWTWESALADLGLKLIPAPEGA